MRFRLSAYPVVLVLAALLSAPAAAEAPLLVSKLPMLLQVSLGEPYHLASIWPRRPAAGASFCSGSEDWCSDFEESDTANTCDGVADTMSEGDCDDSGSDGEACANGGTACRAGTASVLRFTSTSNDWCLQFDLEDIGARETSTSGDMFRFYTSSSSNNNANEYRFDVPAGQIEMFSNGSSVFTYVTASSGYETHKISGTGNGYVKHVIGGTTKCDDAGSPACNPNFGGTTNIRDVRFIGQGNATDGWHLDNLKFTIGAHCT